MMISDWILGLYSPVYSPVVQCQWVTPAEYTKIYTK